MDKEKLKSIFWDYDVNYTGEEIYNFMVGEKEIKEFTRDRVIARMLTSMRWYDLVDIFGIQQLYKFLSDDVLRFIFLFFDIMISVLKTKIRGCLHESAAKRNINERGGCYEASSIDPGVYDGYGFYSFCG